EAHPLIDEHLAGAVPGTVGAIMTEPHVTRPGAEADPPPPVPGRVEDAGWILRVEAAERRRCERQRPFRAGEVQTEELGPVTERGVHPAGRPEPGGVVALVSDALPGGVAVAPRLVYLVWGARCAEAGGGHAERLEDLRLH